MRCHCGPGLCRPQRALFCFLRGVFFFSAPLSLSLITDIGEQVEEVQGKMNMALKQIQALLKTKGALQPWRRGVCVCVCASAQW